MKKKLMFNLCLISVGLLVFTGCSSADEASDWSLANDLDMESTVADETIEWADDQEAEDVGFEISLDEAERAFEAIPILLPSESGRQLSYNVDFVLETIDFMPSIQLFWETLSTLGGYVEREHIRGRSLRQPEMERFAYFELRIPNEELGAFIYFIATNYNFVDYERGLEDFTFAYERQEAILEDLREQEQQLLGELDGDGAEDLDEKRNDLTDIRSQIRDLEEANTLIERDVNYSELTISLSEIIILEEEPEEELETTFGERLQETLDDVANSLLSALQIAVLVAVVVVPWGLIITAIVGLIVYIVKKYKKKSGKDKLLGR